jgi:hypothetical protein
MILPVSEPDEGMMPGRLSTAPMDLPPVRCRTFRQRKCFGWSNGQSPSACDEGDL